MGELWRWWTESWRAPSRARGVYLLMAFGFGALAVVAALAADAAIAAIAALVSIATFVLSVAAPRLTRMLNPENETRERGDP